MRRTRFMTLLFLGLSIAFLFSQDFRWAMSMPLAGVGGEEDVLAWIDRLGGISSQSLSAFAQSAEQSGDAAALAFAAVHPGTADRAKLAERAVARDPKYAWLYYHLACLKMNDLQDPGNAKQVRQWLEKMEAADPDNAAVWLLRGQYIREQAKDWPKRGGEPLTPDSPYFQGLAAQKDWQAAMERAFRAPRYTTYVTDRFDLERAVLTQQGWGRPLVMLVYVASYPIPNLLNVREYANYRSKYQGAKAEQARRVDEALGHYRSVATFGRRMRVHGKSLIESFIGLAVEKIGNEPLLAALQAAKRVDEATEVKLDTEEWQATYNRLRGEDPLVLNSNYYWSALLVQLFGMLVLLFSLLTSVCLLYVNAKQWVRPEKRGRIYQLMTIGENYMPLLFFLSCLGLYLVYTPYANNFHYYMKATGSMESIEPFFFNTFPNPLILPRAYYLPVEHPFGDYIGWALIAVVAAVVLAGVQEWRARRMKPA